MGANSSEVMLEEIATNFFVELVKAHNIEEVSM